MFVILCCVCSQKCSWNVCLTLNQTLQWFPSLGWNTQFMQDTRTSLMHFLPIRPFLALQVHYAPSQREECNTHGMGRATQLMVEPSQAGEANYPFIPFRIFVRNIYPPIYFPFLCPPSPVHYLRLRINVFTPASRGTPRSTGGMRGLFIEPASLTSPSQIWPLHHCGTWCLIEVYTISLLQNNLENISLLTNIDKQRYYTADNPV